MKIAGHIAIHQPRWHLPVMQGVIERRMLVNFRCDPEMLVRLLPPPFQPKLVNGWGVAGICLIRLGGMHPAFLPAMCGLTSENAAHRIAVEWDENGTKREGVFIPRRDTNALLNRLVGGRLFPGVHHTADFQVQESDHRFELDMRSRDGATFVRVAARIADDLASNSIFSSLKGASDFFQSGSLGWSSRHENDGFDGLELRCREWRMEALAIEHVESSFFENTKLFPSGSAKFDSAFLMRDLTHEWQARGRMACIGNH